MVFSKSLIPVKLVLSILHLILEMKKWFRTMNHFPNFTQLGNWAKISAQIYTTCELKLHLLHRIGSKAGNSKDPCRNCWAGIVFCSFPGILEVFYHFTCDYLTKSSLFESNSLKLIQSINELYCERIDFLPNLMTEQRRAGSHANWN